MELGFSLDPLKTIFPDPDQLVDNCLTGDMAAAYILHFTQHTKCWGSKKFISQSPCFDVDVDVDVVVLCCVIIVVELNFIN